MCRSPTLPRNYDTRTSSPKPHGFAVISAATPPYRSAARTPHHHGKHMPVTLGKHSAQECYEGEAMAHEGGDQAALDEQLSSPTARHSRQSRRKIARKFHANGLGDTVGSYPPVRAGQPAWYDNKAKVAENDLGMYTSAHRHDQRSDKVLCHHLGACIVTENSGGSCHCAESDVLCGSSCICPPSCPRRFTGCPCPSSGTPCQTNSCICIRMNRECGVECGNCGAFARPTPRNKDEHALFATGCQNVCLQRGVPKNTEVDKTTLEGLGGSGLFLKEAAKKGEFIGEFIGERVLQHDAESRGIHYGNDGLSFLFDLNRDIVLDGFIGGNNTRFMNHCSALVHGRNCEAKAMLVDGQHRIKFTASTDIEAGKELLFNYGRQLAKKYSLTKLPPKCPTSFSNPARKSSYRNGRGGKVQNIVQRSRPISVATRYKLRSKTLERSVGTIRRRSTSPRSVPSHIQEQK